MCPCARPVPNASSKALFCCHLLQRRAQSAIASSSHLCSWCYGSTSRPRACFNGGKHDLVAFLAFLPFFWCLDLLLPSSFDFQILRLRSRWRRRRGKGNGRSKVSIDLTGFDLLGGRAKRSAGVLDDAQDLGKKNARVSGSYVCVCVCVWCFLSLSRFCLIFGSGCCWNFFLFVCFGKKIRSTRFAWVMCRREPRNTTSKTSSRFPERSNMWSCTSECVFFSPPSYLPDVPDVSSRRRGSIACLFSWRRLLHCLCGFDFSINSAWLLESCSVFQTWGAISDCFRDLQGASSSGYCPAVVSKCSTIQPFLLLVIIVSRAPPFSLAFSLLGFLVEISDEQRFLSLWFFLLMLHIIVTLVLR